MDLHNYDVQIHIAIYIFIVQCSQNSPWDWGFDPSSQSSAQGLQNFLKDNSSWCHIVTWGGFSRAMA